MQKPEQSKSLRPLLGPFGSMTIHQMQQFLVVARAASLSDAANELDVSVQALSGLIRTLERLLGVQLLLRSRGRRGSQLTTNGQIIAEGVGLALDRIEASLQRLDRSASLRRTVVKFGCVPPFSDQVFPGLFVGFERSFPDIEVNRAVAPKPDVLSRVRRGLLDLGVVTGPVDDVRLLIEPLGFAFEMVVLAKADHELAGSKEVSLAVLAKERFILPPAPSNLRMVIQRMMNEAHVELDVAWEMTSPEIRIQMVAAGFGITLAAREIAERATQQGEVVVLNAEGFPVWSECVLVSHPSGLTEAATTFRDYLAAHLAKAVASRTQNQTPP